VSESLQIFFKAPLNSLRLSIFSFFFLISKSFLKYYLQFIIIALNNVLELTISKIKSEDKS